MADEQHTDGLGFPVGPVDEEKREAFKKDAAELLTEVFAPIENVNFLQFTAQLAAPEAQGEILRLADGFIDNLRALPSEDSFYAIGSLAYALSTIVLCHRGTYEQFVALSTMMWSAAQRDLINSGVQLPPPPEHSDWSE